MSSPSDSQRLLKDEESEVEDTPAGRRHYDTFGTYEVDHECGNESDDQGAFDIHEGDSILWRLRVLICASYPVILALLLSVSVNCIILFFAGHISHLESNPTIYSGVSLAITFANVTFCSIIDGLTTAVETLSSQYNGCKNYHMVSILCTYVAAVPCQL